MACKPDVHLDDQLFRHPLIRQLGELAAEVSGTRLLIMHPSAAGWSQAHSASRTDLKPAFCMLIQSTAEGAKHCRLCHILMAVAACKGSPAEQRCHAGASVLVCPVAPAASECIAVISSCIFADPQAWAGVRARGHKLGLDIKKLRQAFFALPKQHPPQQAWLRSAMQAMCLAIELLRQNSRLEAQGRKEPAARYPPLDLQKFAEGMNKDRLHDAPRKTAAAGAPLLVRVVCELARQRPGLPLTVKELAAAARVTPNHFTTLFHQHTGQPFTDYLTAQRMARAQVLLEQVTLNVSEVARQVGYDDPGYFARRFRQHTKLSPREWRNRHPLDRPPA